LAYATVGKAQRKGDYAMSMKELALANVYH